MPRFVHFDNFYNPRQHPLKEIVEELSNFVTEYFLMPNRALESESRPGGGAVLDKSISDGYFFYPE